VSILYVRVVCNTGACFIEHCNSSYGLWHDKYCMDLSTNKIIVGKCLLV